MTIRALLIEDDSALAETLSDYLTEVGFDIDFAYTGTQALNVLRTHRFDVIILDVQMPSLDGLSTCRAIRDKLHLETPVLFLTARDTLEDKLAGFNAGGDDYLVKPFEPEELSARLHALNARPKLPGKAHHELDGLIVDHQLRRAIRDGHVIELHDIHFRLLSILANEAPKMVSKFDLEERLWQGNPPSRDALRTHIYRLRAALDKPFKNELIKTIHGKGYRLAIPN
ncbi:response regulator transcription factor [uncultured Pseudoteredinibacter sp.]|uniref:response regulator transcription factor n=1 Tax=uncultured Pseudoteredinibacter sp. TaxID=1641701 RepID=UPI00261A314E|nr:response regulator transcription factor [uncultured Pseudoteredinibacter sp.]